MVKDPRDRSHACAWTPRVGSCGLCVLLAVASIAVLWGHGTAEPTAALRWMQGSKSADGVGCCQNTIACRGR